MGEHRLRFFVPPHQQDKAVVDLRERGQNPEDKLADVADLIDDLAQYAHSVRSGEIAVAPGLALGEIAVKADTIRAAATEEHERNP